MKTGRPRNERWYALYKGDQFLCQGTMEQIGKYLGIQRRSVAYLTTPSYKKRCKEYNKRLILMEVEE